jgi:hypothetical protein
MEWSERHDNRAGMDEVEKVDIAELEIKSAAIIRLMRTGSIDVNIVEIMNEIMNIINESKI